MRFVLYTGFILSLVILAAYYMFLAHEAPLKDTQNFEFVRTCSDDCPFPALRIYQNQNNVFYVEDSAVTENAVDTNVRTRGYRANMPNIPIILSAHPNSKIQTAYELLEALKPDEPDRPIYFRSSEHNLPSGQRLIMPAKSWPSKELKLAIIEILPKRAIKVNGNDTDLTDPKEAFYMVLSSNPNPNFNVIIHSNADHYFQVAAKRICDSIDAPCNIEFLDIAPSLPTPD